MDNQSHTPGYARDTGGATAAIAGALCVIGSVTVGIQLMTAIGAGSLVEAGGDQRLSQHAPLLSAAEILKFGSAVTSAWVVASVDNRFKVLRGKGSGLMLALGMLAAALLAASAVAGLAPLWLGIGDPAQITPVAHGLGLASAAANGVWALIVAVSAWPGKVLPRWLSIVGGLLAIASLAVVAVPPVGLVTAVLGVIWLTGLAVTFLRK